MCYEVIVNGTSLLFDNIEDATAYTEVTWARATETPQLEIRYALLDDRDF
jgi:hypothetical protein